MYGSLIYSLKCTLQKAGYTTLLADDLYWSICVFFPKSNCTRKQNSHMARGQCIRKPLSEKNWMSWLSLNILIFLFTLAPKSRRENLNNLTLRCLRLFTYKVKVHSWFGNSSLTSNPQPGVISLNKLGNGVLFWI